MSVNAQQWIESLSGWKTSKEIWGTTDGSRRLVLSNNTQQLTGNLIIKNLSNLEKLDLREVKGLEEVTIENCPKLMVVDLSNSGVKKLNLGSGLENLLRLNISSDDPLRRITTLDVSLIPNLKVFKCHGVKVELIGFEKLNQMQTFDSGAVLDDKEVNLIPTQMFRGWKDKLDITEQIIKSILGINPADPLPGNWESKLNDLKKRPDIPITKEQWENDYKDRPTKTDLNNVVQAEADKYKGFIDPKDKAALEAEAKKNGMVPKKDLDDANQKVKEREDEIEKLKKRPTSSQINTLLGLNSSDPLPSNWDTQLVPKKKLDEWTNKFPNKTSQQVYDELQSKPAAGGSGAGTPSVGQQQKIDNLIEIIKKQNQAIKKYGDGLEDYTGDNSWQSAIVDTSKLK